MIQDLINEHSGEIMNLLNSKYGLSSQQASSASSSITNSIAGYLGNQLTSGNLDLSHIVDLFNKNTPNESNSHFSGLSNAVSASLAKEGIAQNAISQISTNGLNDIIKIIQSGKLGNIDIGTVTQLVGALSGKGGGLGNLLGSMFGSKG